MKQFTQEQAQEMYAALEFVQEHCQLYGAGDAAREKIAAASPTQTPSPYPRLFQVWGTAILRVFE